MKPVYIKTLETCNKHLDKLRANGWKLWQMQYGYGLPEGFHAWFWKSGEKDIEIVTHSADVQRAIVEYKSNKK